MLSPRYSWKTLTLLLGTTLASTVLAIAAGAQALSEDAVITQSTQKEMTPEDALARLRAGNTRFISGATTQSDLRAEVRATALGQYPAAFVLSCVDSRVPVETVFDQGIGDIFVGRVAGNIVDDQMLGSMEFATAVAGSPLVVVLGHTSCGAVKGACDAVDIGLITALVEAIQPSVEAVTPDGDACSSSNKKLVNEIAEHNVNRVIAEIRQRSKVLSELEAQGKVGIVGAMYDLANGEVRFLE